MGIKMKKMLFVALVAFVFNISAQVGINTNSPSTTLEIKGKNDGGAVTSSDGILIPKVNSLSVNGTTVGQMVFLTQNIGTSFIKGFHYWSGTEWVRVLNVSTSDIGVGLEISSGKLRATGQAAPKLVNAGSLTSDQIPTGYNGIFLADGNFRSYLIMPTSASFIGEIFMIRNNAGFNSRVSVNNTDMAQELLLGGYLSPTPTPGEAFIWSGNKWLHMTN